MDVLVVSPTPTHPQDHGNRKRFFEYCSELKRQGAHVHFVHYASEHDWRHRRPTKYEQQMIEAWDSYQLVAPSRPLHEASIGSDHTIDEWADPALVSYIRWAFSIHRYDAIIVGYTWMSFCLDAVPTGVFKILDTHDMFSGRRALLEANGIAPEFFHTTPEEESKAFARADLVWAIKEQERRHFETVLGAKRCLTLLFSEPERNWWKERDATDGWLRVGIIGARNNINRRNLQDFLAVALPIFERYMAPVKITLAGGCCEDFKEHRHPNLEILGRVPDVAEFYESMDVICTPMQFSTGLKIKVAEALASGAPLVSHLHAMEGYPIADKLHALPDFESIASELIDLAFDRSGLAPLAQKSRVAIREIHSQVLQCLEETRQKLLESMGESICIVAPLEALNEQGLLSDHLYATINYLRFARRLTLVLTGGPTKFNADLLRRYGFDLRVFVEAPLARALGETLPETWTPLDFEEVLRSRNIGRAYFLGRPHKLAMLCEGVLQRAYLRLDAIELAGDDGQEMLDLLNPITDVVAISATLPIATSQDSSTFAACQIPFRRKNAFASFGQRTEAPGHWNGLLILAQGESPAASAVSEIALRLDMPVAVVDVSDPAVVRRLANPGAVALPADNVTRSSLVVDVSFGSLAASVLVEGAMRAGVPVIRYAQNAFDENNSGISSGISRPKTINTLVRAVARALQDDEFRSSLQALSRTETANLSVNDAGWTWLWRDLTARAEKPQSGSMAASLFS
jgi:glycosyltransferase involved in cell wall biosynthesis